MVCEIESEMRRHLITILARLEQDSFPNLTSNCSASQISQPCYRDATARAIATRVEPHQVKLAGELGAKAGEEEAWRGRVLASAVHERHPPLI